jgi:membrane-associated protease RseP (regulator of RpoE activity)
LGLAVFFHELGLFLIGRWCGVKVDAFSLSFGPEIFGFDDRFGTHWRCIYAIFAGRRLGYYSFPSRQAVTSS